MRQGWRLLALLLLGGCLDVDSLVGAPTASDGGGPDGSLVGADAGADARTIEGGPVVVPPLGFALRLSPERVTLDRGDAFDITVSLTRGANFAEAVDVTVQGQGADLSTNPATLTFAGATTEFFFTLKADAAAVERELALDVIGIAKGTTSISAKATLPVRIGSLLLATDANATLPLPPYTKGIVVKLWGAGGGAGTTAVGSSSPEVAGGAGGAGGFATALFPVDATLPLTLVVGTGGAVGTARAAGGGGGGYSMVSRGSDALAVAGGGAGGGGAYYYRDSITCAFTGNPGAGAAGGGGDGAPRGNPNRSATTTAAGAGGGNGATGGTARQGGDGSGVGAFVAGGVPGGGRGRAGTDGCDFSPTSGGGGGGGGWFGGGGGGTPATFGGGGEGGGGSGMLAVGATNVTTSAGGGTTDPDYAGNAGKGGAGTVTPAAGSPGRIVVRLAKP